MKEGKNMEKEILNNLELTKEDYGALIDLVFYKCNCLIQEYEDEFDPFIKSSIYEEYQKNNKIYLKLQEKYKNM